MNELAAFLSRGAYSTAILRYPTGKFGLVGTIPGELTKPRGGMFTGRDSMVWDTEAEVIAALLAIGIDKFQLASCAWYERKSA